MKAWKIIFFGMLWASTLFADLEGVFVSAGAGREVLVGKSRLLDSYGAGAGGRYAWTPELSLFGELWYFPAVGSTFRMSIGADYELFPGPWIPSIGGELRVLFGNAISSAQTEEELRSAKFSAIGLGLRLTPICFHIEGNSASVLSTTLAANLVDSKFALGLSVTILQVELSL